MAIYATMSTYQRDIYLMLEHPVQKTGIDNFFVVRTIPKRVISNKRKGKSYTITGITEILYMRDLFLYRTLGPTRYLTCGGNTPWAVAENGEDIEKINELLRGCDREENNMIPIDNNLCLFAEAVIILKF